MTHPRSAWDVAFQTPVRLSLMAALGPRTEVEFGTLRDLIDADDSSVSKAVSYLERAGYVTATKGYVGTRPRTWIRATPAGTRAFARHLAALRAITQAPPPEV